MRDANEGIAIYKPYASRANMGRTSMRSEPKQHTNTNPSTQGQGIHLSGPNLWTQSTGGCTWRLPARSCCWHMAQGKNIHSVINLITNWGSQHEVRAPNLTSQSNDMSAA